MEPHDPSNGMLAGANDAARRMEALRRLVGTQSGNTTGEAGATAQSPFAPTIHGGALSRRASRIARQWPLWLALVIIASLVAVVVVSIFAQAAPKQTVLKIVPHPIEITPASDSITCPTDLAWSPNQRMIAVVGYAVSCPSPDYAEGVPYLTSALYQGSTHFSGAGIVAVYDAQSGARLAAFSPDSAVYQAIERQAPFSSAFTSWLATAGITPEQFVAINYTHALWVSDQQRLIVTFTSFLPDGSPITTTAGQRLPGHLTQGLVISDLHGRHMQVALHVASGQSTGMVVWDIDALRVVSEAPASAPFTLQPAALSYSWESTGALTPQASLSSSAQPTSPSSQPIGAPLEGASSFTIWQPGVVTTALSGRMPGQSASSRGAGHT